MSRISRYTTQIQRESIEIRWKVALYARLSKEDINKKEESESIKSQKAILTKFISGQEDMQLVDFYIDDGYSGTNFNRPNFDKLWEDIKDKKVNCVIVKDLSRFGRNDIETSNYIEVMFPMMNVRFISIIDNVDTYLEPNSASGLLVAFKNIMNSEYARDISQKVRSANQAHRRRGEFIGAFAPYGYIKDPNDHHKLIIDNKVAENVKLIYSKFLSGESILSIVKYLNLNKIPTPYQYKKENGYKYHNPKMESKYKLWSFTTLKTILTNPVYRGDMIQGVSECLSFRNKKKHIKPKNEWIIVPNTHEPIISPDNFNKVQNLIKNLDKKREINNIPIILSGLCRCGDCGKYMTINYATSKNLIGKYYFKCQTYNIEHSLCSKHSFRNDRLENVVFEMIKKYITLSDIIDKLIKKIEKEKTNLIEDNNIRIKQKLEENIEKNKTLLTSLYMDLKEQNITEEQYIREKKRLEQLNKNLEQQILYVPQCVNSIFDKKNKFVDTMTKYKHFDILTYEMAHELIERINIFENNKIEVIFKFRDDFDKAIQFIEDNKQIIDCKYIG